MTDPTDPSGRMSRRDALKWIIAAAGSIPFLQAETLGPGQPSGTGYGLDPELMKGEVTWARTMSAGQLGLTAVLADIILPRTGERSPSASELKVPDFIDEWISAPYPDQQRDRRIVLDGLAWIEAEARRRHGRGFTDLVAEEVSAICDAISLPSRAAPEQVQAARFFSTFRGLCLGGYYTTDIGMRDAGYVGNTPMATFAGPPPEVLRLLGIEKAPW